MERVINDLLTKKHFSNSEETDLIEKIQNHPDRIYIGSLVLNRSKFLVLSELKSPDLETFSIVLERLENTLRLNIAIPEYDITLAVIEELLESASISVSQKIFSFLVDRFEEIINPENLVPGKGTSLKLLKMCNSLIKRISKEKNTSFAGKILCFLADIFPLSERSGVNLRGDFNIENITLYKSEITKDELDSTGNYLIILIQIY